MIVNTDKMLRDAQAKGISIGAFNIENMEMAQAVIAGAEEFGAPVIIQTTPSTLRYADPAVFASMVNSLAKDTTVPVAIHLDHGSSIEMADAALKAGYTSIMFDGSALSFEENIAQTKKVVDMASKARHFLPEATYSLITVEAELGSIGGKEDDLDVAEGAYTDPETAHEFVSATGISSLAVAIGTAHGVYSGIPKLDIPRLVEIRKRVSVPLVLHGASGLSAEAVRACIREGVCKVNFATELRIAYSDGVKGYLAKNPDAYDPKTYGSAGYASVKECVLEKLEMVTNVTG